MGKPTYILIVRHGESEGNCDKSVNSLVPNHLVQLTKQGHLQSIEAGEVLAKFIENPELKDCSEGKRNKKSIMFCTSPYLRTRQTCNNIIESIKDLPGVDYSVREEVRMREQDFGNFQSSAEEMEKIWQERAHYGHFFYRIPYGESAADVYDRVASFNESLYRQFRHEDFPNILVLVTHGIWSRVFLMKWFKWTYEEFEELKNIPHCHYLVMKRPSKDSSFELKSKLQTWNDKTEEEEVADTVEESEAVEKSHPRIAVSGTSLGAKDGEIKELLANQKAAIMSTMVKNRRIAELYKKIGHQPSPKRGSGNGHSDSHSHSYSQSPSRSHSRSQSQSQRRNQSQTKFIVDLSLNNSSESFEAMKSN
ncbi:uncharacterized protein LODBEIA_P32570 [Lodderomyces beijingensis]|uniref:Uncharacterized protein n=1 Tax=Lodderomyces beijingensis TaxID=1775926 RepID=A0ABP0ZMY4_9ASCO